MKLFTLIGVIGCLLVACKEPNSTKLKSPAAPEKVTEVVNDIAAPKGAETVTSGIDSEVMAKDDQFNSKMAANANESSHSKTRSSESTPTKTSDTKSGDPKPVTKRTPPSTPTEVVTEPSVKKIGKASLKKAPTKINETTETIQSGDSGNEVQKPKKRSIKEDPEPESKHNIEPAPRKQKADKVHEPFDALLIKYVTPAGKVNYNGFKSESTTLETYLAALSEVKVSDLNKKEQLAFWINAYNAATIKKITDNYPLAAITDLDGGKPWDVKWIKLDNRTLSLNDIENKIIRPTFNEPRIHFAVNCAAKSCPPIMNKAWTAANMETSFEKQTRAFINSSENSLSTDRLQLSKIFEWYAEDFGDLTAFLQKYTTKTLSATAEQSYKEYDWSLNN